MRSSLLRKRGAVRGSTQYINFGNIRIIPRRTRRGSRSCITGFTLIELLVVIAIIGVLASIVLASLSSARSKSRDARRIADIKQIQLALELYYDANSQSYPPALATCTPGSNLFYGLEALIGTYIPVVPRDPQTPTLCYRYATNAASAPVTAYHLGATLEGANPATNSDKDCNSSIANGCGPAAYFPAANGFNGADTAGCSAETAPKTCYDVVP